MGNYRLVVVWTLFLQSILDVSLAEDSSPFAELTNTSEAGLVSTMGGQNLRGASNSVSHVAMAGEVLTPSGSQVARSEFEDFKTAYGKTYYSKAEEDIHFRAFAATIAMVEALNELNGARVFGLSFHADLLDVERRQLQPKGLRLDKLLPLPEFKIAPESGGIYAFAVETAADVPEDQPRFVPPVLDWRRSGIISPTKAQGVCGACWAFSVVQEVESMYALYVDDAMQVFSSQQVASCTIASAGCGGGDPVSAYLYLIHSIGLAQEVFWPYSGGLSPRHSCDNKYCTESCDAKNLSSIIQYETTIGPYATVVDAYFAIPPCLDDTCETQDVSQLARVLSSIGPLSVIVNAINWNFYKGGVMTYEACGNITIYDMDHAVQLVGYNTKAPSPYWIVRNSWTSGWGEAGYIYLEYGKNTCGVGNLAMYPEVVMAHGDRSRRLSASVGKERFKRLYEKATSL